MKPLATLPYARTVDYISPSALRQLERDPVAYYLQRLAPEDVATPAEPQGFAAARGEAFDAAVKAWLEGSVDPDYSGVKLPEGPERVEAITQGARGCAFYVASGALENMRRENEVVSVRSDIYGVVPGTDVPIRGLVDWVFVRRGHRHRRLSPGDWKTSGTDSPTKGYLRHYGTTPSGRPVEAPHPDHMLPMEQIDAAWADQLAVYHWLLGGGFYNAPVAIDLVCYLANGSLRIAQYRTVVSRRWQLQLRDRLVDAWARIQEQRVVPDELAACGIDYLLAAPARPSVFA